MRGAGASRVDFSLQNCYNQIGNGASAPRGGHHTAFVRITGHHTNVVRLEKDENVLINRTERGEADPASDPLTVRAIVEFAKEDDLSEVKEALERQIEYNTAICDEGLRNDWGARVGKTLLRAFGDDIHNRAKAWAAAGSDARMNGCPLPVVVVSGSGNQGITASVPVIAYARHLNVPHEQLLRALALSDLVTIHLKSGIGRLSA